MNSLFQGRLTPNIETYSFCTIISTYVVLHTFKTQLLANP